MKDVPPVPSNWVQSKAISLEDLKEPRFVTNGPYISDTDFKADAEFRVDGDFESDEKRTQYLQWCCDKLNAPERKDPREVMNQMCINGALTETLCSVINCTSADGIQAYLTDLVRKTVDEAFKT